MLIELFLECLPMKQHPQFSLQAALNIKFIKTIKVLNDSIFVFFKVGLP
jgi:hypothetical protein